MEQELRARLVDWGLFHPADRYPMSGMGPHGFRHVPVVGLAQALQFFRVQVSADDDPDPVEHLVVGANHPRLREDELVEAGRVISEQHPSSAVSFTIQARTGWLRLTPAASPLVARSAAVAAATVAAIAGWDESAPIVVAIGVEELDVSVLLVDGVVRARARRRERRLH